jgi:hypothetical protein
MLREDQLKNSARQAQQVQYGETVSCENVPAPTLLDRVKSRREQAQKEVECSKRLSELESLLEKHPEVGRIWELLHLVQ